jgi:hypothetical protein
MSSSFSTKTLTILNEALKIAEVAKKENIPLRIIGACAILIHSKNFQNLYLKFERELTDLDFITYSKYRDKVKTFLLKLGYEADERFIYYFGEFRHKYYERIKNVTLEVFFDKIEMCHTIDLSNRLELDYPTIPPVDLLMEKLQIVEINEKDLKDLILLLRAHDVSYGSNDVIDVTRIAKLLSRDWGFYYTVNLNLERIKNYLSKLKLEVNDEKNIEEKIEKIKKAIEDEPKTLSWKMRAKIGLKKKWYREVEEVVR